MNKQLLLQLIVLFIAVQIMGLGVGYALQLSFMENPEQRPVIVNDNPDDSANSVGLILWILFTTGIMLVALKYLKGNFLEILLKIFEALAVFGAAWLVLMLAFGEITGLFLAILLVVSRNVFPKNIAIRNYAGIFAAAGAGALIGSIMGILPVILFLILLSVYDYIAVFKTKHMVSMAKEITNRNLAFTYAFPTKEHKFELGTGDMVIPLVFAISVLGESMKTISHPLFFLPSIIVLAASLAGLLFTINYVSKRIGKALPALPLQTAFMIVAFGITKAIGL